jgi:hypothetical protein
MVLLTACPPTISGSGFLITSLMLSNIFGQLCWKNSLPHHFGFDSLGHVFSCAVDVNRWHTSIEGRPSARPWTQSSRAVLRWTTDRLCNYRLLALTKMSSIQNTYSICQFCFSQSLKFLFIHRAHTTIHCEISVLPSMSRDRFQGNHVGPAKRSTLTIFYVGRIVSGRGRGLVCGLVLGESYFHHNNRRRLCGEALSEGGTIQVLEAFT